MNLEIEYAIEWKKSALQWLEWSHHDYLPKEIRQSDIESAARCINRMMYWIREAF